ncbi:MAG: hypothetical protein GXY58_07900, partial [Planctomycetaceae bacterium]|nr:hypothetical protein [Planctomycetaceae bacterium]
KKASIEDPALVPLLQEAVKEHTAGSPVDPGQLWTNRSPAELANEMTEQGHPVDRKTVQRMLKEDLGLSRRQMVKTLATFRLTARNTTRSIIVCSATQPFVTIVDAQECRANPGERTHAAKVHPVVHRTHRTRFTRGGSGVAGSGRRVARSAIGAVSEAGRSEARDMQPGAAIDSAGAGGC